MFAFTTLTVKTALSGTLLNTDNRGPREETNDADNWERQTSETTQQFDNYVRCPVLFNNGMIDDYNFGGKNALDETCPKIVKLMDRFLNYASFEKSCKGNNFEECDRSANDQMAHKKRHRQ